MQLVWTSIHRNAVRTVAVAVAWLGQAEAIAQLTRQLQSINKLPAIS